MAGHNIKCSPVKQTPSCHHDESSDYNGEDGEKLLNVIPVVIEKLSLGRPRRTLLVLDLAGILCDRVFQENKASIPEHRDPDATYGKFLVYKRPYCEEFVKFCFERFYVGIWSSAKKVNLDNALDCVIGELKSNLLFIWAQDECTNSGFSTLENRNKPIFFKELDKLWQSKSSSTLPWCQQGQCCSSNTLLIDDKPYKALLNPPHTAIFPAEYKADQINDADLGPNGKLRLYLDGVAKADDVPAYVKEHPFGQTAITATHPDWDYYYKVINGKAKESASGKVMNK